MKLICCQSRAFNAHMENKDKYNIQYNINDGGHCQEDDWRFAIAKGADNSRQDVI